MLATDNYFSLICNSINHKGKKSFFFNSDTRTSAALPEAKRASTQSTATTTLTTTTSHPPCKPHLPRQPTRPRLPRQASPST